MTLITILSFYLQGLLVTHLMVTLFCKFLGLLKLMRHCMSSLYKSFFLCLSPINMLAGFLLCILVLLTGCC